MKIFQTVKETKEKYDQRHEELLIQKGQLKKQLEELRREYEDRIAEDELGGKVFTSKPQMKEKLRNLEDKLEEVEHRINVNRKGLHQALADLVPAIRDWRSKKKANLQKKHEQALEDTIDALATYCLKLQEVHSIKKEFDALNTDVQALQNEVGTEIGNDKTVLRTPELWIYSLPFATSKGHLPSRRTGATIYALTDTEISDILNSGKLPVRVQEYIDRKKGAKN
ncbi:hypothetical protein [Ammoniphilus sp. CFH 90114]|uniref:hypothetical protein n=1 Tax=Ammoniphilus sp. CFH 90114 TaxID=2493665 RepID=UPI00100E105D|nr:hypothetical protein [Ammoniphilus sp. CFH 90114]RXT14902.1 hypothetical protein EIZ39_01435 [Ammoniphilus sp. CFH 90114]